MIEELKRVNAEEKIGGRFKLTAMVQKRLKELMEGSRPLIEDAEGKTVLEIVIEEIKEGKIGIAETQEDEE